LGETVKVTLEEVRIGGGSQPRPLPGITGFSEIRRRTGT